MTKTATPTRAHSVECKECGARFDGDRTAARRARWEPYSYSSQQALDSGPMICSDCIGQLLDRAVEALKKVPASAWKDRPLTDRQIEGWACRYCEGEPEAMVPDGETEVGQLFACEQC